MIELESLPRHHRRGRRLVNLSDDVSTGYCTLIVESLTVVIVIIVINISQLFEVDLVPEDTTDTAETLHKLVAFSGPVRDELECCTEVLVMLRDPFEEGFL